MGFGNVLGQVRVVRQANRQMAEMKRSGSKRKIFGIEIKNEMVYWVVAIVGGVVLIMVLMRLFDMVLRMFAASGANASATGLVNQNNYGGSSNVYDPNAAVRTTVMSANADALRKEIKAFNQSESDIVDILNSCLNAKEVAWLSSYYKTTYGSSLKADVQGALDSWWNPLAIFGGTKWTSLKDYVQQNLV